METSDFTYELPSLRFSAIVVQQRELMTIKKIILLASLPVLWLPLCARSAPAQKQSRASLDHEITQALDQQDLGDVKALVSRGANANARGQFGRTPLLLALYRDENKTVQMLLEKGAHANDADIPRFGGETPLMLAARHGNAEAAKLLLAHGADANAHSRAGQAPLLLAALSNSNAILKLLLDRGVRPDDMDFVRDRGETPLMIAAHQANVEGVKLLIDHGANVNAHESHGASVLLLASNATNFYSNWNLPEHDKQEIAKRQAAIILMLKQAGATEDQYPAERPIRTGENVGF